jgi:hypothetical protein
MTTRWPSRRWRSESARGKPGGLRAGASPRRFPRVTMRWPSRRRGSDLDCAGSWAVRRGLPGAEPATHRCDDGVNRGGSRRRHAWRQGQPTPIAQPTQSRSEHNGLSLGARSELRAWPNGRRAGSMRALQVFDKLTDYGSMRNSVVTRSKPFARPRRGRTLALRGTGLRRRSTLLPTAARAAQAARGSAHGRAARADRPLRSRATLRPPVACR